jgi:hypothetical protein
VNMYEENRRSLRLSRKEERAEVFPLSQVTW